MLKGKRMAGKKKRVSAKKGQTPKKSSAKPGKTVTTKKVTPKPAKPVAKKKTVTKPAKPVVKKKTVTKPAKPVVKKKTVTKPAKPVAKKKTVTKPAKPVAKKKTVTKPAKPVVKKKAVAKPAKPVARKRAMAKPAKPVVKKKAVAKPAKPVVKKKAVAKPAKPVAKKKTVVKPAKPVVKKKAVAKPAKPVVKKKAVAKPAKPVAKKKTVVKPAKPVAKKKTVVKPAKPVAAKKRATAKPALSIKSERTSKKGWDINLDGEKFFVAREQADFTPSEEEKEFREGLPDSYNDQTSVTVMVRDPFKLYAYWEIELGSYEDSFENLGGSASDVRAILRIFDVTGTPGAGHHERSFDLDIDITTGDAYVDVDRAGAEYVVALALINSSGAIRILAVSNRVETPRSEPSAISPAGFQGEGVDEETFWRLYRLSSMYKDSIRSLGMGSSELSGVDESASSYDIASFGGYSSETLASNMSELSQFDCELPIQGHVTPGADLTLNGIEVKADPDGEFVIRLMLRDGEIKIDSGGE